MRTPPSHSRSLPAGQPAALVLRRRRRRGVTKSWRPAARRAPAASPSRAATSSGCCAAKRTESGQWLLTCVRLSLRGNLPSAGASKPGTGLSRPFSVHRRVQTINESSVLKRAKMQNGRDGGPRRPGAGHARLSACGGFCFCMTLVSFVGTRAPVPASGWCATRAATKRGASRPRTCIGFWGRRAERGARKRRRRLARITEKARHRHFLLHLRRR